MKKPILIASLALLAFGCSQKQEQLDIDKQLEYCVAQATKTLDLIPDDSSMIPRNVPHGTAEWTFVIYKDWTSGFWPGILWYLYEATGDAKWKDEAVHFTNYLKPLSEMSAINHDLGFQVFCSAGNGYRLTGNGEDKTMVLKSADTLATLYNPLAGTILSWPEHKHDFQHNTIIDNMINLELLFWASKNGGDPALYDLAVNHAETTMENHFREDFSAYHVIQYDTITGQRVKGITHQGFADETMWARGQAWAIYGFTMVYRETNDPKFLAFAQKVTDVYLERLPEDMIPFWDFDAPNIPNEPKDASAAAITASALLELSLYVDSADKAEAYRSAAEKMLLALSSEKYMSKDQNTAFLLHSTGHHPNGTEIDASIIYADYYYLEALLRLKKLKSNEPIIDTDYKIVNANNAK
ncbi:glycoside hydrolase family 88 protein [Algoriphagus jejuensis]|uniref:Glycoside hydrolase family 88 protein n=1 Tax=Algoriphagus jejuensis TaxID=419934 RepID=A0ABP3Y9Q4_9BACT